MELFKLFGTIGLKGVEETKEDIQETTDQAEQSGDRMESAFKKIGAAIATYLTVDAIKNFGAELVNTSAEVSAEASAFEQIMGDYSDKAQVKMNQVADNTGVVNTRLTGYMTSMTAKFKGLGYDIDDATTLASDGLTLASDAAAFWDKSLDDSMSSLNSFINGSYEGGEAIGLFANETQMAQFAIKQGIVKTTTEWQNLDEATKQATRLEYAKNMYEQSGATGQAAKEASQYANVQANLNEKWRQFKAQIGEPLLQNVVLPAMEVLSGLVDGLSTGFQNLTTWINENKTAFELICIAVGTLTTAILAYNVAQNASAIVTGIVTAATSAWGAVMAFVTSPITLVVAAIGGLIAIGVLLYKNWDTIKEYAINVWTSIAQFFSGIWESITNACSTTWNFIKSVIFSVWNSIKSTISSILNSIKSVITNIWNSIKNTISNVVNGIKTTVSNVFNTVKDIVSNVFNSVKNTATTVWNGIKTAITKPMETAKGLIKGIIDSIKGFFNFKISWPKIPLPHFSIKPKNWGIGDLLKGKIPSLGISWYAKAMDDPMLLSSASIFGMKNGKLLGGGEKGSEYITGEPGLKRIVSEVIESSLQLLIEKQMSMLDIIIELLKLILEKNPNIVLDDGTLIGKMIDEINKELYLRKMAGERGL